MHLPLFTCNAGSRHLNKCYFILLRQPSYSLRTFINTMFALKFYNYPLKGRFKIKIKIVDRHS